ncbi:Fas apoptotic inhibitory molecule 1 [Apostichopus japonicus]|uniref:Fas apoptotic inhibitory molecule 1 n=1 Tax=Stichopus japonicus TaxID=307972 RepID=A0A2G8LAS5_STIJA|nr:Fas apoptotic inhibitory molecule 1 [Apostichopus japonicus]
MADVVALWDIALSNGIHKVKFEHGTTSGKRTITIDDEAVSGFAYEYTLEIDGKSLKKFVEHRAKTAKVWTPVIDGVGHRVVFEKDTMDVWCDGEVLDTAGEFVEGGSETHFEVGGRSCCIRAVSSGKRREGIIHSLLLDDREIPEAIE